MAAKARGKQGDSRTKPWRVWRTRSGTATSAPN